MGAAPAFAQSDAEGSRLPWDRYDAVEYWQTGGAGVREAAERALLGTPEDLRKFLDEAPAIEYDDDYVDASRIYNVGGVAVREATKKALKGTPEELQEFLGSGWQKPLEEDREVEASRVINFGGLGVKEAGKEALKTGPEAVKAFLETGQYEAQETDNEVEVSKLINSGGPNMKAAGKAALKGTPQDIAEFLAVGQFVARNRDQEHATIEQLTEQAKQAGVQAEAATKQAEEASARAVAASNLAKEAAKKAAEETEAARKDANRAAYKAKQAAASARAAAAAAQTAIGAANAANRAARIAALAAAQTANAAAAAANAANNAYNSAIAAAGNASQADAAKKDAIAARKAATLARTAAAAVERAAKASAAAGVAAAASRSAGANANAAADSAEEANRNAEAAGVHSAEARNAAADARRHANAANRAANNATSLAQRAAQQAYAARDAANSAAGHAEKAADAADLAVKYAGQSATAAANSRKWAGAAKAAADTATAAVNTARQVHQVALAVETEELASRGEAALERARTEKAQSDQLVLATEAVIRDARALDGTAEALAIEASKPEVNVAAAAAKGRKLALDSLRLRGPWHQQAAADALSGADADVLEYLRNGWKNAAAEETRDRVLQLSVDSPYLSVRKGASEALEGTPEQITAFYTDGQYTVGETDLAVAVSKANNFGGISVKEASKAALKDGSGKALAAFLEVGQYSARLTDEEVIASKLVNDGGEEVQAAAKAALASPPSKLHEFIAVGQYMAARKDDLTTTHRAQIGRLLAEGEIIAANAQANRWRAAEAAAKANGASTEAANAAGEAKKSAAAATVYAAQAKKSADAAAVSAGQAHQSATTARNAADAANRDADAAEASAAQAEFSAEYARQSAREASESAEDARGSATAAGKSAAEAEAAASQAWAEVKRKREVELAEAKRQAEEARKEQAKKEPGHCGYTMVAGYAHPNPCEESDAFGLDDLVGEIVGASDIEKCIKNPTWGDCAMAVVAVTPLGKLKIVKKGVDAVEDIANGTRRGKEAIECAAKAAGDSFPSGTRVLMDDRTTRPIEQIRVGDHVLATNPETGTTGPRRVEATIYTPDDRDFTSITLDQNNGGDTLTTTSHHPFWAENDKKWKKAADLTPQNTLRTPDGHTAQINSVRRWTALAPAYNLTVTDLHTYYVLAGQTPVLVHNASPCKEIVLDVFDTYEPARNKALELLGEIDSTTRLPYVSRMETATSTYNKIVGFTTRVNGEFKRFRLDWDPEKGPHINVEVGKGENRKKWAVPWTGTEEEFIKILDSIQ
ncbi:polymorphic toxin-type HINT domain-containing protein [Streptomyces sp. NBC_00467]|uniref:polymorphic toxin-type HINT domain-containing protein n=1 Tax=Streptomyces sp. NBC_00467 TaxID=2975752 RepID=UPI003FA715BB